MANEYILWRNDLLEALRFLRNIEFQLNGCSAGASCDGRSFREAMYHLYTRCHFEKFVSLWAWQQAGFTEEIGRQIQELKALLDDYQEPDTDAEILMDPYWNFILFKTQQLLKLVDKQNI